MEMNWAHSIDQCQLQALQFLVNLINLLSILPRCNGYFRIQKALVDETISKPPNSDHALFLVQIWFWEVLWSFFLVQPLSWWLPVVKSSLFCHTSQCNRENCSLLLQRAREDDTSKWQFFWFMRSVHEAPTYQVFYLSNLLQMLNDHRMIDIVFFINLSRSCQRISFDDPLS